MSCFPHFGTAAGIGKEMGAGSVSTTAPNVAGNSGSGFEVISLGRILGKPRRLGRFGCWWISQIYSHSYLEYVIMAGCTRPHPITLW